MQRKTNKTVLTTRTATIQLDDVDIVELLRKRGEKVGVGDEVSVYVQVPGGGDWSNEKLIIGRDTKVVVQITSKEIK